MSGLKTFQNSIEDLTEAEVVGLGGSEKSSEGFEVSWATLIDWKNDARAASVGFGVVTLVGVRVVGRLA